MRSRLVLLLIGIATTIVVMGGSILALSNNFDSGSKQDITGIPQELIDAQSQQATYKYITARVVEIKSEKEVETPFQKSIVQEIDVEILSGDEKGSRVSIDPVNVDINAKNRIYKNGEKVYLQQAILSDGSSFYNIYDKYRLSSIVVIAAIFLLLTVAILRLKGIFAAAGLIFGIFILAVFTFPQIISGSNIIVIALISAVIISIISVYLSHGFNLRTSASVIAIIFTLFLSTLVSLLFINYSSLFGLGDDNAFYLKISDLQHINLQALLIGGIIISCVGVLDDVCSAQSATVSEIHKTNRELNWKDLFSKSMSVGKEHIASMVNTLVLIYVGASMPMFLLLFIEDQRPLQVILNTELISQEVVSSLIASTALVLGVPITAFITTTWLKSSDK